jgi:integrase
VTRPIGSGGPAQGLNREENAKMVRELGAGCNGERNQMIWILGTTTAMRVGEMLGLRVRDIRLEEGVLRKVVLDKTRTKSGRSRVVPIPAMTRVAIAQWLIQRGVVSEWLFPSNDPRRPADYKSVERAIVRAGARIGLSHIRSHSMRRTCAENWRRCGASLVSIQHLLGHTSLRTTQIYLGISDEEMLTDSELSTSFFYHLQSGDS